MTAIETNELRSLQSPDDRREDTPAPGGAAPTTPRRPWYRPSGR